MKVERFPSLIFACLLAGLSICMPARAEPEFSFGVIAHAFKTAVDESVLRDAIAETDADNLAFVVANGIKANSEPCSDAIYNQRKALLDEAKNGLILSLAASDWTDCKRSNGRSAALERLNRVRELFYADEFSFGAARIPLIRQSSTPKFRSYGENARWDFGNVMFATINLPSDNNHYLSAAGRNSEFEDRLIANRDWLQRVFVFAARKKMDAVVLFCDGDPLFTPGSSLFDLNAKRDGFAETRQYITALAAKFPGKVLIIHGRKDAASTGKPVIVWNDKLGDLEVGSGWVKLGMDPALATLFAIIPAAAAKITHR